MGFTNYLEAELDGATRADFLTDALCAIVSEHSLTLTRILP